MLNARLRFLLPPPIKHQELPTENDWLAIERAFCPLPSDFKAFVSQYGTGSIGGFIWIFNPASRNEHLNLTTQIVTQLRALHDLTSLGLKGFPEVGGILPFGITDNGDVLAWKVLGSPDSWRVVVVDSRAPRYSEFEVGFSRFIGGVLERAFACRLFPSDFPSSHVTFHPPQSS